MSLPPVLADENIPNALVEALTLREPSLDIVRAVDKGLGGLDDPTILEWAASEGRVIITRDPNTMTKHGYERLAAGLFMPGMIVITTQQVHRRIVEDILVWLEASSPEELASDIKYVPIT
jgi:predicted nuclease of predicted toxin-antitoxin system